MYICTSPLNSPRFFLSISDLCVFHTEKSPRALTARTRAAAVVVAFPNVPHAPAPEKASMQPVPQCIEVTPHHPHWEQHWPYVDPAQVWVPLHCPSTVIVTPEVDEPVEAGADPVLVPEDAAGATPVPEEAAGTLALGDELVVEVMKLEAVAEAEEVTGMMVMAVTLAEEALDATGAGELAAGELAAGEDAGGAGVALLPDVPADPAEPPDELDDEPPPIPPTAAQVPVKPVPDFVEDPVTSGPGLGKTTSSVSTVVQPFPKFATNMSGRDEKATVLALFVPDPPAMVMEAQF